MRTFAAACTVCFVAGCATDPRVDAPVPVRSRVPIDYQSTVADYFDIMMPGPPAHRRLSFGEPEASGCALYGSGGRHQGWMVPVIYDTSPVAGAKSSSAGAKTSTAGTRAAPAAKPVVTSLTDEVATATLNEVKISGKGYFFWFSDDTIAAVTRRADGCPP
jgi:hypothetical protein